MTWCYSFATMVRMLKIRLRRVGRKHDPSFRLVVTESVRGPKSGNDVELLGNYNARTDQRKIKGERVLYWISQGAQVSDTVHNLLVDEKVIEGKKVNVLPKKTAQKKEEPEVVKETTKDAPQLTETKEAEEETASPAKKETKSSEETSAEGSLSEKA